MAFINFRQEIRIQSLNTFYLLLVGLTFFAGCNDSGKEKPNIIYILADDLGYGDLGAYGQEKIKTPFLDQLATEGMVFTRHYSGSTVCAPSRASLLTGMHTGHTSVRGNREIPTEGQFPMAGEDFTLAEMLKGQGYNTAAFGKWGLGFIESSGDPMNQGFDQFFGYNCQRQAHRYYPKHLWDNQEKVELPGNDGSNKTIYAHDIIHQRALEFLDHQGDRPFFLYLPYVIPHAELLAPDDSILQSYLGNFPESPYLGVEGSAYGPGWEVRRYCPQPNPHATYAAMVSRLDRDVGAIIKKLKEMGLAKNTLVIFTSDNGPDYKGGADPDFFNGTRGLRGYKRDLYEGGVRVPMIAWWPGKIQPSVNDQVSAFWDIMPTVADLVGTSVESDGVSLVPTLFGEENQKDHAFLYWEFVSDIERQAVLMDDWKLVKLKNEKGVIKELYNLEKDPNEAKDLSNKHPEIVDRLDSLGRAAHTPNEDFPLTMIDE